MTTEYDETRKKWVWTFTEKDIEAISKASGPHIWSHILFIQAYARGVSRKEGIPEPDVIAVEVAK
jgi:hypothetical protein